MVVSITSTVNLVFGSRIMDTVTGVLFNNEVRGIVLHNTIECQRIIFSLDGRFFNTRNTERIRSLAFTVSVLKSYTTWTVCSSCADNYPEANKRPLSSTVPTIIEHSDGSFYVAIGGSGGAKIFPAIFQVILNLDWGLDIGSAVESGRLHHQLYPEWIEADNIYPYELLLGLKTRGHSIHGAWRFILDMLSVMTWSSFKLKILIVLRRWWMLC